MEAMKKNLMLAVLVVSVMMAFSGIQKAAAADAPAPTPTSDATTFLPKLFASLAALAFGFFF